MFYLQTAATFLTGRISSATRSFHFITTIIPFAGGNAEGPTDISHSRRGQYILRDRHKQPTVCDPRLPSGSHRRRRPDADRVLRLGHQERAQHGLGADQVRPDGGRVGDHDWSLYRLQHEPGEVVCTGIVEQSVGASLDLLVRPDRRCSTFRLRV